MKKRLIQVLAAFFLVSWLGSPAAGDETKLPAKRASEVTPELMQRIEKELALLSAEAKKETGPIYPRKADELAYYLLAGLTVGRPEVKKLSKADEKRFGLHAGDRKAVFQVGETACIVFSERYMQDKAGSYYVRIYSLYLLRQGEWKPVGSGESMANAY
jgi:hypothetical protein